MKYKAGRSIRYTYDMAYWAKKWKVSVLQIAEAIRNTGTTELNSLKSYLKRRGASVAG